VTGVQTCALPICSGNHWRWKWFNNQKHTRFSSKVSDRTCSVCI